MKTTTRTTKKSPRLRKPRGQAMVEYTIVGHFLLLGGGIALLPAINLMLKAITTFYDSVYTVIQTAAV